MTEPVDQSALKQGLLGSLSLVLDETDLRHAVGETGTLRASVEIFIERGHARWTKGSVSFEHRRELGGRR